jgi:hypothetical protein
MRRAGLVILLVTMGLGLAGGLAYAWILSPIDVYDAEPDTLRTHDKLVYLALVGDLYAAQGDLTRAKAELAELGIEAEGSVLTGFIEQHLDAGGTTEEVRNLARLAEALGASGGVLSVFAAEPTLTLEPTATAVVGIEASPTAGASRTPVPTFRLVEQTAVCAEPGSPGQISVWVRDAEGGQLAGVEVVVSWATGQDRFFTGLRPERGEGYADFEMEPGLEYEVSVADYQGESAEGLTPELDAGICPTGTLALEWRVTFQQMP